MAFVNLKEKNLPAPDSRHYTTLKDKECKSTFYFIVHSQDAKKFASVSASYILNRDVEVSNEQQITGLSDNSYMFFTLKFSSIEDKEKELEHFKLALKTAKFYEMKKN